MAAAAICTYPDFYSAAVASAGNHDNNMYNKGWVEIHYGVRESKKMVKDSLGNEHEEITYFTSSKTNMDLAKNYKSGLLLVTGDMDNTVHPAHTMKMADALIKAGKYFDMLVLPGNRHGYGGMAEYFYGTSHGAEIMASFCPVPFRGFICRLSDRFGLFHEKINLYCINGKILNFLLRD